MTRKKKITLGLIGVLLAGLAILTYIRWEVWFGNPPEAPYTAPTVPSRVLLTFGNEGALSRNVSWQCDSVLQTSYLELGDENDTAIIDIPATGEVFASRSGKAAYYVARLTNLNHGQCYRYRVVTGGKCSPWYSFVARDAGMNEDFSFLYFGDVQDSLGGIAHKEIMKAWCEHPEVDFAVFGGDLTERPTDEYWNETFRDLDTIGQQLPILCATGNHEYLKYPIRRLERRFSLVFSYFLQSMVGENQVYALNYGNLQLYLLDSNREWPYLMQQKTWLEEQMKHSPARWNVVVLHHPIYSAKSSSNNLTQRWAFASTLNDYADLVLQGHEHAYARMTHHNDEGQPTVPVYTVSHCSPKQYRIEFDERFDRFGTGTQFYQLIAVRGDTLQMNTYDAATGQLYDRVNIVKGEHDHVQIVDEGQQIPEILRFTPRPGNKKDAAFADRIRDYKRRKGIR